jgi:hypothetical protein
MRQDTVLRSIVRIVGVLSLVAGFALGLYGGALILGSDVVYAKGDGGGGGNGGGGNGNGGGGGGNGGGGNGNGGGGNGNGAGKGGSGAGSGASGNAGAGVAGSLGSGDGKGDARGVGADQHGGGVFAWVMRSFGLVGAEPGTERAPPAPPREVQRVAAPGLVRHVAVPAVPRERQAFRFEIGAAVFPSTGGMLMTEGVDGVDVVTVDERHHRIIHPAAFFEPHEGAQYDRRALERFWPIELGKRVRFVETVGKQRWLHVMSAVRVETVSVPAGVFRAFVVERATQPLGEGPRPVTTRTYWYAPDAGAIVETEIRPGDGRPTITEEAEVVGYPLAPLSTASAGTVE